MQIICQVTGAKLNVQGFGSVAVRHVHPVCSLPLPALNKLAAQLDTSAEDDRLLLCAYLFQSGLVKFSSPISAGMLKPEFVTQQLPAVVQLANAPKSRHKLLPTWHVQKFADDGAGSSVQTALKSWLEECHDILEDGSTLDRRDAVQEFKAIRRATATRSHAAAVQFADILHWGFEYLSKMADYGRCSDSQVLAASTELELERVKNTERRLAFAALQAACATPSTEPLSSLKSMRTLCLEYLPERDDGQVAKKDAILARINANILLRAEFFAAIGGADDETMSIVESIATNYTIVTDSGSAINSAKPAAQSLVNLLAGITVDTPSALGAAAQTSTITPSSEPKPEQYPSRLAYILASRAWAKNSAGV